MSFKYFNILNGICDRFLICIILFYTCADKKVSGKSKDEQMAEKKQELEKRLQDVTGQLGNVKKTAKKGWYLSSSSSMKFRASLSRNENPKNIYVNRVSNVKRD